MITSLTAGENLRLGAGSIDGALEIFPELQEHLGRKAGLLSGGQQQMVALGRVMSSQPKVLLVDELSLGLAPLLVARLVKALRAAARTGMGVLLVEQYAHTALANADRALVLQHGRVVLEGTAANLLGRLDDVERAYFLERHL